MKNKGTTSNNHVKIRSASLTVGMASLLPNFGWIWALDRRTVITIVTIGELISQLFFIDDISQVLGCLLPTWFVGCQFLLHLSGRGGARDSAARSGGENVGLKHYNRNCGPWGFSLCYIAHDSMVVVAFADVKRTWFWQTHTEICSAMHFLFFVLAEESTD